MKLLKQLADYEAEVDDDIGFSSGKLMKDLDIGKSSFSEIVPETM